MSEEPVIVQDKKKEEVFSSNFELLDMLFNPVKQDYCKDTEGLKEFLQIFDTAEKFNLLKQFTKGRSVFRALLHRYRDNPSEILPTVYQELIDEQIVELLLQKKTDPDFGENCSTIVAAMVQRSKRREPWNTGIAKKLLEGISDIEKRSQVLVEIIKQLKFIGSQSFPSGREGGVEHEPEHLIFLQIQAILALAGQRETSSSSSDKPDAKKEMAFLTTPFKDFVASDSLLAALAEHSSITALLKFSVPELEARFLRLDPKERYPLLKEYYEKDMSKEQDRVFVERESSVSSSSLSYLRANELAKKAWELDSSNPATLQMVYQTHCFLADRYRGLSESLTAEPPVSTATPVFNKKAAIAAYTAFAEAVVKDDCQICYQQQQFLLKYHRQQLLTLKALGEPPVHEDAPYIDIDFSRFPALHALLNMFVNIHKTETLVEDSMKNFPTVWRELPNDLQLRYQILSTLKGWKALFFCVKEKNIELLENMLEGLTSQQSFNVTADMRTGRSPFILAARFGCDEILQVMWGKLARSEKIKMLEMLKKMLANKSRYFDQSLGTDCAPRVKKFLDESTALSLPGEPAAAKDMPNIDINFSAFPELSEELEKLTAKRADHNSVKGILRKVSRILPKNPQIKLKIFSTAKGFAVIFSCVQVNDLQLLVDISVGLTRQEIFTLLTTRPKDEYYEKDCLFSNTAFLGRNRMLKLMWEKLQPTQKIAMHSILDDILKRKDKCRSEEPGGTNCISLVEGFFEECKKLAAAAETPLRAEREQKREAPPPPRDDASRGWVLIHLRQATSAGPARSASSSAMPSVTKAITQFGAIQNSRERVGGQEPSNPSQPSFTPPGKR